jgi:hypothetical protein
MTVRTPTAAITVRTYGLKREHEVSLLVRETGTTDRQKDRQSEDNGKLVVQRVIVVTRVEDRRNVRKKEKASAAIPVGTGTGISVGHDNARGTDTATATNNPLTN